MNQRKFTRNKSKKKTNKPNKSFFMKLRKKIYERTIRKKYGDPYIKILIPKDEIIEKEQIPKYIDLYKTNKLITKYRCRLYSLYIDINLYFSSNEYLIDFFKRLLSNILIKYNIYNNCNFYPNYFPLEKNLKSLLSLYISKIKRINKKKIKEALGEKEEKNNDSKSFHSINDNSNFLQSLIENELTSEKYSNYLETNINLNKENKKLKDNEINEIENFIERISKIEFEKEKKEKEKREIERRKKREKEKLLRKKFKETQKEIKRSRMKKIVTVVQQDSILLKNLRRRSSTVQSQTYDNNIEIDIQPKFKQIIDFIGGKKEKEKLEFKKDYVLEKLVEISKNKKKYICGVNYLKKVKNGYYKDIPDSFIGINDFSENQKNLNALKDTQKYLKKVSNTISHENDYMRKSFTLKKIIKCPNIYTLDYDNNNSYNIKKYYLNVGNMIE